MEKDQMVLDYFDWKKFPLTLTELDAPIHLSDYKQRRFRPTFPCLQVLKVCFDSMELLNFSHFVGDNNQETGNKSCQQLLFL